MANVSLNFTNNASSFIGGSNASFRYLVTNNETGSCSGGILNGTGWTEVALQNQNYRVCNALNFSDTNDTFNFALWLQIPYDTPKGSHNTNIYATACDDGSC
jgi:hypothetical protein